MSWKDRLKKAVEKLADKTKLAEPIKVVSSIEDDGKALWCKCTVGEVSVRERLPRDILKWDDARQGAHLDEVVATLTKKLKMQTKDKPASPPPNRKDRRRLKAAGARKIS